MKITPLRIHALIAELIDDNPFACRALLQIVLVDKERISGIFDWGCSLCGDHLYELAWFDFW